MLTRGNSASYFNLTNIKVNKRKFSHLRKICNFSGLQALHEITNSGSYRLRVDLEDWEGNQAYAEYS